jgi:Family of unknown function (DUF5670)
MGAHGNHEVGLGDVDRVREEDDLRAGTAHGAKLLRQRARVDEVGQIADEDDVASLLGGERHGLPGELDIDVHDENGVHGHALAGSCKCRAGAAHKVGTALAMFWFHKEVRMSDILWLVAAVLLVAWLLGIGGVYTIGGIVHVLLVLAVVAIVINLLTGRRTVV